MQKERAGRKERLQYWFDKQMARGLGIRILMLICASLIMIIILGILDM